MKIVVTGAGGFVGQHLLTQVDTDIELIPLSLQSEDWMSFNFATIDSVIHLAGKAHQMTPIDDDIYFQINTALTKQVFQKAKESGVPHFIYISSTKVYGDGNYDFLDEKSECNPTDAYGKSKLATEQYLLSQPFNVAIVRPPLVYGKGVKGNMEKLVTLCNEKSWLPFGGINNKRAMVYVGNLNALILQIAKTKATGIFIAGDQRPVSTTELVAAIAASLNKKIKLISIPQFVRTFIKLVKPALYVRLFGSFNVSNSNTNKQLNFTPPFCFEHGITKMIN